MYVPKVSVILPTYNRAKFLKEAIESILRQDFIDFELIISDNCSTDHTEETVQSYLLDARVKYYKNTLNVGAVKNHNLALRMAKGEYICPFSDDDIMLEGNLKEKVEVLDKNSSVVLVHSSLNTIDQNGNTISQGHWAKHLHEQQKIIPGIQEGKHAFEILDKIGNYISMTTVLFRKKSIDSLNIEFNNQLKYLIDWDLWINLSLAGDFFYIDRVNVLLRRHNENESSVMNEKTIFNELILLKLGIYYRQNNSSLVSKNIVEINKTTKNQVAKMYPGRRSFFRGVFSQMLKTIFK